MLIYNRPTREREREVFNTVSLTLGSILKTIRVCLIWRALTAVTWSSGDHSPQHVQCPRLQILPQVYRSTTSDVIVAAYDAIWPHFAAHAPKTLISTVFLFNCMAELCCGRSEVPEI